MLHGEASIRGAEEGARMKPVMQTKFGEEGNCGQACVASILGLDLDEVPDFREAHAEGRHWQFTLRDFLLPLGLMPIVYYQASEAYTDIRPKGHHIAGGRSPRMHPDGHYVVCFNGEMVHDPHPDGAGLLIVEDWILLVPVRPTTNEEAQE